MASRSIKLRPKHIILFTGDSITDAGRNDPAYEPYGNGYVNFAAHILRARHPEKNLTIINTGVHGDTARKLHPRWEKDCIAHKPNTLSVMIGINDLWRQHVEPERLCEAVYPQEYEVRYRNMLLQAEQRCHCRLVLMEPFMFCDDPENPMLQGLSKYLDIVRRIAKDFKAVLVPLQSRIEQLRRKVPAEKWSADGVHPYPWVHAWIALQWLEATGLLGHSDGGGKPLEIVEPKKDTKGRAGRSSART